MRLRQGMYRRDFGKGHDARNGFPMANHDVLRPLLLDAVEEGGEFHAECTHADVVLRRDRKNGSCFVFHRKK